MRVKTRWNNKSKPHSIQDIASAMGFNTWRIACNGVLNLENEGFQTDTQRQRLDIIAEFLVFLIHTVDRLAYDKFNEDQRSALVTALALNLVNTWVDNARDIEGPAEEDRRADFIARLNEGMAEYAEMPFTEEGPGFAYLRLLGDRVAAVMGPKDNRWIMDQMMAIEAPDAIQTLRRVMRDLTAGLPA